MVLFGSPLVLLVMQASRLSPGFTTRLVQQGPSEWMRLVRHHREPDRRKRPMRSKRLAVVVRTSRSAPAHVRAIRCIRCSFAGSGMPTSKPGRVRSSLSHSRERVEKVYARRFYARAAPVICP